MECSYIVKTAYDAKSIRALTRVNYNLYQFSTAVKIYLTGIALILFGLLGAWFMGGGLALVLLIIGCVVLANGEYPAHQAEKLLVSQLKKDAPEIELMFYEDYFRVFAGKKNAPVQYSAIERLSENVEYFFIFLGPNNAYTFKKTDFTHGEARAFKSFIEDKTGLGFERPKNALLRIFTGNPFKKK